ncbi:Phosphoribosylformylglycinamidine synthase subunit PurS [bioreactor metagenome]|uniref:Phosphoribosylformylglycinamidine synthase subunit PurS n=1 Tax=bioreactor metagenome TaxID=1076179 RepID=A0A645B3D5_9ZZZZ
MKNFLAKVTIVLREGILDAQGKAIENSLHSLNFNQLNNVKVGKIISFNVAANTVTEANSIVNAASKELLANTIVEDYTITINEIE